MAMTNAEKVRAFRNRQRKAKEAKKRQTQGQTMPDILISPFHAFFERDGNTSDFEQVFDMMGIDAPVFDDDSGPKSLTGYFETVPELRATTFAASARSLDRAEIMIGGLLDAATALAGIVRAYKLTEIATRIEEITDGDLSDPAKKQSAIDRIIALNKLREELEREIRWPVPQWRVEKHPSRRK